MEELPLWLPLFFSGMDERVVESRVVSLSLESSLEASLPESTLIFFLILL